MAGLADDITQVLDFLKESKYPLLAEDIAAATNIPVFMVRRILMEERAAPGSAVVMTQVDGAYKYSLSLDPTLRSAAPRHSPTRPYTPAPEAHELEKTKVRAATTRPLEALAESARTALPSSAAEDQASALSDAEVGVLLALHHTSLSGPDLKSALSIDVPLHLVTLKMISIEKVVAEEWGEHFYSATEKGRQALLQHVIAKNKPVQDDRLDFLSALLEKLKASPMRPEDIHDAILDLKPNIEDEAPFADITAINALYFAGMLNIVMESGSILLCARAEATLDCEEMSAEAPFVPEIQSTLNELRQNKDLLWLPDEPQQALILLAQKHIENLSAQRAIQDALDNVGRDK